MITANYIFTSVLYFRVIVLVTNKTEAQWIATVLDFQAILCNLIELYILSATFLFLYLGILFSWKLQLYACFVVSPVTYTSVTLINRKNPLDVWKISCFFPHPYPHSSLCFFGEDLNSVQPGILSHWASSPKKPKAKTNSPFIPKTALFLPGVFGVLSLSCNGTVGCLGLQTCQDKPTMGSVLMQYVSREREYTEQPKDKLYILLQLHKPPNVLPTQPPTPQNNNYLLLSCSSWFQIYIEN